MKQRSLLASRQFSYMPFPNISINPIILQIQIYLWRQIHWRECENNYKNLFIPAMLKNSYKNHQ